MNIVDIIVRKRDGHELTNGEIRFFVDGLVTGAVADYQAAAWAMAVYFQGMTDAETANLTMAMAESGDQLDQHACLGDDVTIVDKHSSGGVGDKTTLAVGPIVAACGVPVGKMSGRGLSYTGGTIDKLESISGWHADLDARAFCNQLRSVGLVLAEQTAGLAPADKALYALRDVTGTVPSLPLIASSIMSKKLAAGADAIVLDVTCGEGAFMQTIEEARHLAQLMVTIGKRAGCRVTALITQMQQPLGYAVGNSVEVKEAIQTLQGNGPTDFAELVTTVATEMLLIGSENRSITQLDARTMVTTAVETGAALKKFESFVIAQGGDAEQIDNPDRLQLAPVRMDVHAMESGTIQELHSREIGLAVVDIGGGRHAKHDSIDHGVGVVLSKKVGDSVERGEKLATIYARSEDAGEACAQRVLAAFSIGDTAVEKLPIVYERISSEDCIAEPYAG